MKVRSTFRVRARLSSKLHSGGKVRVRVRVCVGVRGRVPTLRMTEVWDVLPEPMVPAPVRVRVRVRVRIRVRIRVSVRVRAT